MYKHKIYIIHIYAAYLCISGIQTAKVGPTPGHFDHIVHVTFFFISAVIILGTSNLFVA